MGTFFFSFLLNNNFCEEFSFLKTISARTITQSIDSQGHLGYFCELSWLLWWFQGCIHIIKTYQIVQFKCMHLLYANKTFIKSTYVVRSIFTIKKLYYKNMFLRFIVDFLFCYLILLNLYSLHPIPHTHLYISSKKDK